MRPLKKKKHSLTLLEVAIAICLTAILVPSLWHVYQNWLTSYKNVQLLQNKLEPRLFLKQRLERIGLLLTNLSENNFIFTPNEKSEFPSVCFSYTNEPDVNPAFNDIVRSLLYVDNGKQLCLTTWGSTLESRTEILLTEIKSLEIFFFNPETNIWQSSWNESTPLPIWIKLVIENSSNEPLEIKIRSSFSKEPILYLEQASNGLTKK